jgi:hypothetical protein
MADERCEIIEVIITSPKSLVEELENNMMRAVSGRARNRITNYWRNLHKEKLHKHFCFENYKTTNDSKL